MKCLSFGYFVLLLIITWIAIAMLPAPLDKIMTLAPTALLIYFIAGFFMKCDDDRR